MPNNTRTRKTTTTKKAAPAKKPAPKKAETPQYRQSCADEFAALKASVQVIQRLGYRGPTGQVKWTKASDRPEAVTVPEDGTAMPEAMAEAVATARAALDALDKATAAQAKG